MFTLPLITASCVISWVVVCIAILLFLIIAILAFIYYRNIIKKEIEKEQSNEKPLLKICYNAAVKVFSLNGLISILFISALALVFYTISIKDFDANLTILTISFTLAAIVPYIIGRSIAKNEVDKIVEEKFNEKFKELSTEYSTSLFSLRKNNAHTRRIAANLLRERVKLDDQEWALGWAAEAIIGYALIHSKYEKSGLYADECNKIFNENTENIDIEDIIKVCNTGKYSGIINETDIHFRTLKSILSMHAITEIYKFSTHRPSDKELFKIEKALFQFALNSKSCSPEDLAQEVIKSCTVSDIPISENVEVVNKVEGYMKHITTAKS